MKKRKLTAAMLSVMLASAMLIAGCSKTQVETAADKSIEPVKNEEAEAKEIPIETSPEIETAADEAPVKDIASLVTEKNNEELNLKEYMESFEDRKIEKEGEAVFYLANFEEKRESYRLSDSVSIYGYNGTRIGYTKPGITITTIGEYDGWYYFNLDKKTRFAKAADIEANDTAVKGSAAGNETGNAATKEAQAPDEEAPAADEQKAGQAQAPVVQAPVEQLPVEQPPAEPAPAQSSNKYTPEEAVEVYKSLMIGGGLTWNPSLKNGGSWGTGWIYLEKGQPEWCASTSLESYAMGDSVGNPWTDFYFEVTGSDENAVYITEWAD